jgi:hypothetical protein
MEDTVEWGHGCPLCGEKTFEGNELTLPSHFRQNRENTGSRPKAQGIGQKG